MKEINKSSFVTFAVLFFLLGLGGFFMAKRTVCVPLTYECYFVTEGNNVLDAKGLKVDPSLASIVQTSPYILFPLSGILLLVGLLRLPKSD
ncbi:MAG: hypothetical protein HEQ25_01090 [Dolichospermum sp. DET73]|jgi:hypothetical protein|nr:hypothetical protein [Dolichospermum sp. DET73]